MSYSIYSYNSLTVPLDIGTWQCELVLSHEYDELVRQRQWLRRDRLRSSPAPRSHWTHSRSWTTSGRAFDRDGGEDAIERREREEDRRIFDLYFRPKYDFRQLIASDINAITSFLHDHLNVAHWDLPTDNAGIERMLKQAITEGRLVPVVNRNWRSHPMTFRPTPAPLRWPPSVNSRPMVQAVPYGGGLSTTASTAPLLAAAKAISVSAGDDSGGFDWLGVASENHSAVADDADTSTPLGDARPFEYTPDAVSNDVDALAGSEGTPGNNHAQNRQFRAVVKALGLNQDQAQELHQEISKQGLGYHDIMERAKDMFGGTGD